MMHGVPHHLHTDRVAAISTSCGGGIWRLREDVAGPSASRMQTVFWKHMEIDIAKSGSERVSCHVDARLVVLQNGSTQRDEAVVMYMHTYDPSTTGSSFIAEKNTLYSLEIDTRSYERVRRDEKLLVDFSEFRHNLVWLLEQSCSLQKEGEIMTHQGTTTKDRSFRVVLHEQQGKLEFLECNAFRELSHLKLCIQTNSDKGTAKYLSFRLQEVLEENTSLHEKIENLEKTGRQMYHELSGLQDRISADTYQRSNEASTWKIQCDMLHTQISHAKEQHEFLQEKLEAARIAEDDATRALSDKSLKLSHANDEIQRLQGTIQSLERSKISLEDSKRNQEKEIERLKALCDGYKSASDMADARIEDWKRMATSHEEQAAKHAQIIHQMEKKISRVSQELSEARKSSEEHEKRIHQREELMETQEEALKSAQSRVSDLQQQHRHLEQQLVDRDKKLEDAMKKLEASTKKAESSDKMIVWLNKQLTSIQLKSGSNLPCISTPLPPVSAITTSRECTPKTRTPNTSARSRLSVSSGGCSATPS